MIVATVRALKMHGGVGKNDLGQENVEAVKAGCANLKRHVENVKGFGVPVVVAINQFLGDTDAELEAVRATAEQQGAKAILCAHWADGGAGAEDLARHVVELADSGVADFKPIYEDSLPLWDKVETVSRPGSTALRRDRTADDAVRRAVSTSCRNPTATSRCAWPRPSTRSPPIRTSRARPRTSPCRYASCGFPAGPSSWWLSPARS